MQIIRNSHNIQKTHQGLAVTIGNFDGLHLGHCELLTRLKCKATALHCQTMAIIFEPLPVQFLKPEKQLTRLMSLSEKLASFKDQGIDYVLCLQFNRQMADLTPEQFVTALLIKKLEIRLILVGDDFRFGHQRVGDFKLLQALGIKYHFQVEKMSTYQINGQRVSSTAIRQCLESGELRLAQTLLGKPFQLSGTVVHGDKRGSQLGFPTANVHLHRKRLPLSGVFVVEVLGVADHPVKGVANIGVRPTIAETVKTQLEVHLLNFKNDIYGRKVTVRFLAKLRHEKKFESLAHLKEQIQEDVLRAIDFFKHHDTAA